MRKSVFLFLLAVLPVFMLAGCEGEERAYWIDKVDVITQVLPDGDLYIEEMFTYTFQGTFHRAKRSLETGSGEGIEFFEAFVPPKDKELGQFSYEELTLLKTEWDPEERTFYTEFPAEDETRQIFYRYRVDQAASRYADAGELAWKFFSHNLTDLHHVTVDIVLPKPIGDNNVHAFLHDRTGGQLTKAASSTIRYENEKLSPSENADIRVVFPSDFLAEAPVTSQSVSVQQLVEEEQQREKDLVVRDTRLRLSNGALIGLTVLLAAVILYCRHPWRLVWAWLHRRKITFEELEQADPVLISYVYRKGNWQWRDYLAGLFSMHRRGLVRIEEAPADNRLLQDPSAPGSVLRFVLTGERSLLQDGDHYLAKWLFRQGKNGAAFRMDSFTGAPVSKRRKGQRRKQTRHTFLRFCEHFNNWKAIVGELEPYKSYIQPNRLIKPLLRSLALLHWGVVLFLYYVDANSWSGLVTALTVTSAFAAAAAIYYEKKWVMAGYLICCLYFAGEVMDESVNDAYWGLSMISLLMVAVIPRRIISKEAAQYRFAILAWRRQLRRGAPYAESTENRLERLAKFAIILDAGVPFINRIKRRSEKEGKEYHSPLLQQPVISGILFIHQSLFTPPSIPSSGDSDTTTYMSYGDSGDSSDSGGGDGGTGAD